MLSVEPYGEVIQFRLQRKIFGRLLGQVNVFLVDGLLVDTGPAALGREMLTACRGYHLEQIVNTHHHEDHIGNNALLQREFSLPIRAHRAALPAIRQPRENLKLNLNQRFLWGRPAMAKARRIGNTVRTPHYLFRVLVTPGPSPDHICLYEESQGWLFTGDLLSDGSAHQFYPVSNQQSLLESLRKVAQLAPAVLFCASNGVVSDPGPLIQKKIEFWEKHYLINADIDTNWGIGVN